MSDDPLLTAADNALDELLDVSPQIQAVVVLESAGGKLISNSPSSTDQVAVSFGETCMKIVEAAEQSRRELDREPVSQIEVGTAEGHIFIVTDHAWVVAALTDADPTVGLVFYDLKTALRAIREADTLSTDISSSNNGKANKNTVSSSLKEDATLDDDRLSIEENIQVVEEAKGWDDDELSNSSTKSPVTVDKPNSSTSRWRRRGKQS